MKTTYRHPLEQNDTLKYIALIVGALIILVLVFCLGSMTRVTAADNQAGVEPISTPSRIDYQQLYDESLLEIDALNATIQELTEANSKLEETNRVYAEHEDALNDEIQTQKETIAALKETYGTTYYVEYELRRTVNFPGAEDIVRFYSIVPKNVYDNTIENMSLPLVSEMYSLPSGNRNISWSIIAHRKYPIVDEID